MAKIDVSKIEGYAAMTPEQKVAALEGYDLSFDTTGYVSKNVYDKTANELATLKRAKKASEENAQTADETIKDLKKELTVMKLEKRYIADGYSEEDANAAATAYYDGDTDKMFELQHKHLEAVKKSAAAEAMKQTPPPKDGEHEDAKTDYSKEITQAQADGDYVSAAYYMRLQSEANNKQNE